MKYITALLLLLTLTAITISNAYAERLTACIDRTWYPYTFLASYKGSGIYVDMFEEAGERLGLKTRVKPVTWSRCVEFLKQGDVDVVLGISYSEPRTEFLYFPMENNEANNDYRLNTLEDVIVTMANSNYEYQGDPSTIPQPVRAPAGYIVTKALSEDGLVVDNTSGGDQVNLIKLIQDQSGSAVMLRQLAQAMISREFYDGQLHISEQPYTSRHYFMAFSIHTKFSEAERWEIWQQLKMIREDRELMLAIEEQYVK